MDNWRSSELEASSTIQLARLMLLILCNSCPTVDSMTAPYSDWLHRTWAIEFQLNCEQIAKLFDVKKKKERKDWRTAAPSLAVFWAGWGNTVSIECLDSKLFNPKMIAFNEKLEETTESYEGSNFWRENL